MSSIYFYKLTADSGGAPCVQNNRLSLAICKPMIRMTAKEGDLIFGFAANSLSPDNRLIYVARITEKLYDGNYYKFDQYSRREDCIYEFSNGRFEWRNGAKHHGPVDLVHDLGKHPHYPRANVLLSRDFRYFGKVGTADYKSKFSLVKDAVEELGRGQRVHHDPVLHDKLRAMADWIWGNTSKMKTGEPTSAPSRRICHRTGPCEIA